MSNKDKKPAQFNPTNERMKYKYMQHLRRVLRKNEKTILTEIKHIRDYEIYTDFAGFEKFNEHVADKYIQSMSPADLSLSYISDNLRALKDCLRWLERQRGYRSKINYNHIDYLNISNNQRKTAKATEYQKSYKFEQIIQTIRLMPSKTDKERRDRAIISMQALCALRISELRTVKMKSLIEEDEVYFIYVCPKHMESVKFAKTRHANFMSLPDDIRNNVIEWRDYLRTLGFKDGDPLFPKIDNRFGQENLLEQTIQKAGTTIRNIFKKAFESAGFEYIRPHSFRKTWVRYAEYQSPTFLNAVRQNLGHKSIDTTVSSYGDLSVSEQRRIISGISFDLGGAV